MAFTIKGAAVRARDLLREGAVPLGLVTLVFYLLPLLGLYYGVDALIDLRMDVSNDLTGIASNEHIVSSDMFAVISYLVMGLTMALNGFHMSAVTEIAVRVAADKPIRPKALLLNALTNTVPVFGLYVFLLLCLLGGGLLLLVPGVFLGAAFSLVVPVYVCEGKGVIEAGIRSWRLTEGHRLKIAAVWAAIGIVGYVASTGMMFGDITLWISIVRRLVPADIFPELGVPVHPVLPVTGIVANLMRAVIYTLLVVFNAAIYLTLRFQKSSTVDRQVVEVFE